MPHPDEGLIHAWLDGALEPDEAARVAALVRDDAAWSAAAAEARGLIANASRVLASLDDGPVSVSAPARAARAPVVSRTRQWGWRVSSVAAVLLVAVVARLTWREETQPDAALATGAAVTASPPDTVSQPVAPAATPAPLPKARVAAKATAPTLADAAPTAAEAAASRNAVESAPIVAAAPAPAPTAGAMAARREAASADRAMATSVDSRCVQLTIQWDGTPEPETVQVTPWPVASTSPDSVRSVPDGAGGRLQLRTGAGQSMERVVRLNARGDTVASGRVLAQTRCRE